MKQVIYGKLYDTEKASELASWSNGYSSQDGRWVEETLYRTVKGNYFIFGRGGWLSRYVEHDEFFSDCNGCEIRPVTKYEAAAWVAERDGNDMCYIIHDLTINDLLDIEFQDEVEDA